MKYFALICLLAFGCSFAFAQTEEDAPLGPELPREKIFQLYLDEPVKSIEKIEYLDDEGTPLKFELGKDGKTVYLYNYTKAGTVEITAIDKNGEQVEIKRSKCYIDPVIES